MGRHRSWCPQGGVLAVPSGAVSRGEETPRCLGVAALGSVTLCPRSAAGPARGGGRCERKNFENHGFRAGPRVAENDKDERGRDLRLDGPRGHPSIHLLQGQRRLEVGKGPGGPGGEEILGWGQVWGARTFGWGVWRYLDFVGSRSCSFGRCPGVLGGHLDTCGVVLGGSEGI